VRRRDIWGRYQQAFAELPIVCPAEPEPDTRHAYHLYTIRTDEQVCGVSRDALMSRLGNIGIGTGVHYRSLAQQPYYQERFGWRPEDYPVSTLVGDQTISLPLGPKMSDDDIDRVVDAVTAALVR